MGLNRLEPAFPMSGLASRLRFFLPVMSLLLLGSCFSPNLKTGSTGSQIELLEHKISFVLPAGWKIQFSEKRYFQLTANSGSGNYAPGIEYRGLSTDLKDRALMDQYARGWYNAMDRNFPNFQFTEQKDVTEGDIVTYYFEGTFTDGNLTLKKIGFLRFVNKKIHAIYYTAPLAEFDSHLSLFKAIDKQIRFLN